MSSFADRRASTAEVLLLPPDTFVNIGGTGHGYWTFGKYLLKKQMNGLLVLNFIQF